MTEIDSFGGSPKWRLRRWHQFNLRTFLLLIVAVSAVLGYVGWRYGWTRGRNPLPPLDEIASIQASLFDWNKEDQIKDCNVASKHWKAIRSAFSRAYRDYQPANWTYLGTLRITTNDDEVISVTIYNVARPGAFSVQDADGNRLYFRGVETGSVVGAIKTIASESVPFLRKDSVCIALHIPSCVPPPETETL